MNRTDWRVVAWMCVAHVATMTGFSTFAALLPQLQHEWNLSNADAGLVSGAFFGGYMVAVPLLTSLTDRIDARRVYFASTLAATCGLAGFALFARGTASAAMFHAVVGTGIAGTYMPGLKALADRTGGPLQARAVSFYTAIFGIGLSVSALLAGKAEAAFGWRGAFALAALGPPIAGLMVLFGLEPRRPHAAAPAGVIEGLGRVVRDARVRPFILGYAVHCWELFGSRSWMVAFLVFAQGAASWSIGPIAIVAMINMLSPVASILGNETALRIGRARLIRTGMAISAVVTCLLGFQAGLPVAALAALVAIHIMLVMVDSSALTAGLVAAADERERGAAMALHSTLGFGAGFLAPLAFGVMLDAAGGNQSTTAWGLAFVVLGIGGLFAPLILKFRR